MVHASAHIARDLRLAAPVEAAWALLADVPRWGVLFPHVVSVEPFAPARGNRSADADLLADAGRQPDAAFLWRMAPMGPPGGRVETVYACRYHADPARHTLAWTPIAGVGTAQFAGALWADGDATAGTLRLDATLEIPAPSFVRGIVQPAVAMEMGRMTDTFLTRLGRTMAT